MTDTTPLWQRSAQDLCRLYAERAATPVDVLESCLGRSDAINPRLNALVTLDREGALAAAEASSARWRTGRSRGALDGIPITVKDNIPTAGLRSTWGSRLYGEHLPERDETPVRRLREAGAILLGKTNVPEMTLQGYTSNPVFGTTRNPWNEALTPGGSSGGAVAATAAGIAPIALGTDGGGSIRRPASHAGLVGLKPTWGRVPRRDGFPAILLDLEVIGPIARRVGDLAAACAVISASDPDAVPASGFPPIDWSAGPPVVPLRILYVPTFAGAPVDREIAANVREAAGNLAALGHEVEESSTFDLADRMNAAWPVLGQSGMAWLMRSHPGRSGELGPDIAAMAEAGRGIDAATLFGVLHDALLLRQDLAGLFRRHDLLLTPTAAALPWPAEVTHPSEIDGQPVGPRGSAIFTGFVNASGCPAISVPCRPSASGLPVGFQLVAPWGGDERLLQLAADYEVAHPWAMLWEARA